MTRLAFVRRGRPVIPEHRTVYKLAQIVAILGLASRGGRSSLLRLQLFNWAMKSGQRMTLLARAAETDSLDIEAWGFDPALSIALRFAVADGLIETIPTGYRLLDKGRRLLESIEVDGDVFSGERQSLMEIGKRVTEGMVTLAAKRWGEA